MLWHQRYIAERRFSGARRISRLLWTKKTLLRGPVAVTGAVAFVWIERDVPREAERLDAPPIRILFPVWILRVNRVPKGWPCVASADVALPLPMACPLVAELLFEGIDGRLRYREPRPAGIGHPLHPRHLS